MGPNVAIQKYEEPLNEYTRFIIQDRFKDNIQIVNLPMKK